MSALKPGTAAASAPGWSAALRVLNSSTIVLPQKKTPKSTNSGHSKV